MKKHLSTLMLATMVLSMAMLSCSKANTPNPTETPPIDIGKSEQLPTDWNHNGLNAEAYLLKYHNLAELSVDPVIEGDIENPVLTFMEFEEFYTAHLERNSAYTKEQLLNVCTDHGEFMQMSGGVMMHKKNRALVKRYDYLMALVPGAGRSAETVMEHVARKTTGNPMINGSKNYWDADEELFAFTVSQVGQTVDPRVKHNGYNGGTSLNKITWLDVAAMANGYYIGGLVDTAIEILPDGLEFEFQVSPDNYFVKMKVVTWNPVTLQNDTTQYGTFEPNGPIIYNPLQDTDISNDYFEGPFLQGFTVVTLDGLTVEPEEINMSPAVTQTQ